MKEKIKNFFMKKVEGVKNAIAMKEAELKGRAHAALDGTVFR